MLPVRLEMSAFGPYTDKTVIEFDKLGKKGMYLVTGDTGAGKTTIFDAITFVLFGEPSGESRKVNDLRSAYAKPTDATYVEFDFLYNGEIYKIKRNPEYNRPSKKGDRVTTQKSDATFFLPDGTIISGVNKVVPAVEEKLGLDRKQFSQICMIAQGEFLKLLLEKTENRQKIFRGIFKTYLYEKIQEKLKSRYIEQKKISDSANEKLKANIGTINKTIFNNSNLDQFVDEKTTADTLFNLEKHIELDTKEQAKLKKVFKALEDELLEVNKILDKDLEIKNLKTSLLNLNLKIETKNKNILLAEESLNDKTEKLKSLKPLEDKIIVLKKDLDKYKNLEEYQKKLKKLKKDFDADTKKNEEILKIINDKKLLFDKKTEELKELKNISLLLSEKKNEQALLNTSIEAINTILTAFGEYKKMIAKHKENVDVYKVSNEKYDVLKKDYDNKYKLYLDNQAGVLADKLEEGVPCPVCGSKNHPKVATVIDFNLTEDKLEKLNLKQESARKKMIKDSEEASKSKERAKTLLENIFTECKKYVKVNEEDKAKDLHGKISKVSTEKIADDTIMQKEIDDLTIKNNIFIDLEKELPNLEKDIKSKEEDLKKTAENLIKIESDTKHISNSLEELSSQLNFKTKKEADAFIIEEEAKIKKANEIVDLEKNNVNNIKKELDNLLGQVTVHKKRLDDYVEIDEATIINKKNSLQLEKNEQEKVLTNIAVKISHNKQIYEKIKTFIDEFKEQQELTSYLGNLSDTANGTLSKKEKFMFETYIQSTYFEKVIERANIRFLLMTNNQYELRRKLTATNKISSTGLELEVIDYFNNSIRDASSLSGGEAFKASLALALGLSDEVQNNSGGIKIDTMFIDEGFGSLDENSLNQAIKTLADLDQGNKLVGIISHVNELKEKIDNQIVITKVDSGGSKVKILGC